jgi:hypothetical protein
MLGRKDHRCHYARLQTTSLDQQELEVKSKHEDNTSHQVTFDLQQENEWPPVAEETVLAKHVGEQRFELESIPYFIRYLSLHDVVFAENIAGHEWRGLGLYERSGHSAVRILPHSSAIRHSVCSWLEQRDCTTQYHDDYGLLAVDIPVQVDTQGVLDFLFAQLEDDVLEFETGWLGD